MESYSPVTWDTSNLLHPPTLCCDHRFSSVLEKDIEWETSQGASPSGGGVGQADRRQRTVIALPSVDIEWTASLLLKKYTVQVHLIRQLIEFELWGSVYVPMKSSDEKSRTCARATFCVSIESRKKICHLIGCTC